MRLTAKQQQVIIQAFREYFGPEDHLWLFGSRVDDTRKGGDIDLYIETHEPDKNAIDQKRSAFNWAMQKALGEQKIDIVINNHTYHLRIYDEARETGIVLT